MILGCLYRQQGLSIENEILYYSTLYAAEFYTALAAMLDDMIENHLERLTPELVMAGKCVQDQGKNRGKACSGTGYENTSA